MQMQTVPVDNKGTTLGFIDSGPPHTSTSAGASETANADYTTLVCIHGNAYHSRNFQKLSTYASKHNARIVAVNRRDYTGSTPYSETELHTLLHGSTEEHKEFMKARGLEIARFLDWFIKEQNIPSTSVDKDMKKGGLAILGWSAGAFVVMSFLRHLRAYPEELVGRLKSYLRQVVLYEPACLALGCPRPSGAQVYTPLTDRSIPERQRGLFFGQWASSHFTHPSLASRALSGLQFRIPENPAKPPTNELIPMAELSASVDIPPTTRSEPAWVTAVDINVYEDQVKGALFEPSVRELFPELTVKVIWGTETTAFVILGVWHLEDRIAAYAEDDVKTWPIEFVKVEGANHFLHWEDPDKALTLFL